MIDGGDRGPGLLSICFTGAPGAYFPTLASLVEAPAGKK
jgi:hypothetical protein